MIWKIFPKYKDCFEGIGCNIPPSKGANKSLYSNVEAFLVLYSNKIIIS
jgi:hypothetical protein